MTTWRSGLRAPLLLLLLLLLSGIFAAESHPHHVHAHRRELQGLSKVASLTDEAGPWNAFKVLLGAQLGDVTTGLASLKSYLLQFGYIDTTQAPPAGATFTDTFDNVTQSAIMLYQRSFGLTVTGRLDVATLTQMIIPRCGREDVINGTLLMLQNGLSPNVTGTQHLGVQHFSTFAGNPRWTKQNLTYAINASALSPDVTLTDTETAIDTAFATWAAVLPLSFSRIQSLATADITISFDTGNHGDGYPFDGPFGVLAHAFAPTNGGLHFDQQESWTLDVGKKTTAQDMDLGSVAVHEIGHLLGLGHSGVNTAVMFPSITALQQKRTLDADDIAGAQSLYGTSPSYAPGSATGSNAGDVSAAVASWRRMRVRDAVAALAAFCLALAPSPSCWFVQY